ncbi:MAG: endonuclease/exonuclease/phosphatase family protein [Spirochaetes bacterium]|nr:endonuclease/exonuclease/phosphatase family protein [Spirochaetota bacterium]
MKKLYKILTIIMSFVPLLFAAFYFSTYHPREIQNEKFISNDDLPVLQKGKEYKVLSWNVQYMAGKNYVFFYDEWDGSGPDVRPSSADIAATLKRVAEIITDENPDIILLQEMDYKSKRTDYQDQMSELLKLLPAEYSAHTDTFYWKAAFVPHPKIMGKVGMKLAVISKYKITSAVRYQLPLMPNNYVVRNLQFKRAILEAVFPVENSSPVSFMSTHLDAFAQGSDTMQRQVQYVSDLLSKKNSENADWIIAGDFNLLPPGNSYDFLPEKEKPYFQKDSEIKVLYDRFSILPSLKDLEKNREKYFTHFANYNSGPDRTIDYMIHSDKIKVKNFHIRSEDTKDISDHFPVIMTLEIK